MANSMATMHQPCRVPGCDRLVGLHGGRGYCGPHAHRFRRYGDPLAGPRGAYGRTVIERFLSRVDFDGPGGCWLHPARNHDGYATVATELLRPGDTLLRGTTVVAHRYMWWIVFGECPAGELDHTCYRRNCVNVAHLEVVARREHLRRGNEQRRREREALRILTELHPDIAASL